MYSKQLPFNYQSHNAQETGHTEKATLLWWKNVPKLKTLWNLRFHNFSKAKCGSELSCPKWNRSAKIRQCFDKPCSFHVCIPKRAERESTKRRWYLAPWNLIMRIVQNTPATECISDQHTYPLDQMRKKKQVKRLIDITMKSLETSDQRKRNVFTFSSGKRLQPATWSSGSKCSYCYSVELPRKIDQSSEKSDTFPECSSPSHHNPSSHSPYSLRSRLSMLGAMIKAGKI